MVAGQSGAVRPVPISNTVVNRPCDLICTDEKSGRSGRWQPFIVIFIFMSIQFVVNEPALLYRKILAIADLHLGYEYELAQAGIRIPNQTKNIITHIKNLIEESGAKRLVIVGDIKHHIPGLSYHDFRDIPNFFDEITEYTEVFVVKGNHDGDIEKMLPSSVVVYKQEGFRMGDIGFFHGNVWPEKKLLKAKYLAYGHLHPLIKIASGKAVFTEKCWVIAALNKQRMQARYKARCSTEKIVFIPAFNPLLGGKAINDKNFNTAAPLITSRIINIKGGAIYLLDGTSLCTLRDIIL